jgi:hypothetical protein
MNELAYVLERVFLSHLRPLDHIARYVHSTVIKRSAVRCRNEEILRFAGIGTPTPHPALSS